MDSNTTKIVLFNLGEAPDHRGRLISDIWGMSDEALETTHDYVQWLFPIPESNGFNDFAPVLTEEARRWFQGNEGLRLQQDKSVQRMLRFYGLQWQQDQLVGALHLHPSSHPWLNRFDHNHRRISRMISSVSLCHQPKLAGQLKAGFISAARKYGDVSDATFEFWRGASNLD